jgi:putative transposase
MSRNTGYKGIARYRRLGPHGLAERSRKPGSSPTQTPAYSVRASIEARPGPPAWGAKKRLSLLGKRHPHWPWPARSTVGDLLSRPGLVPQPRTRRHSGHPGQPTTLIAAPNDVGTADVTGQCKTGDGRYGDPLTVADGCRRFLLGCPALSSTRVQEARPVFVRLFKDGGLPKRSRPDPGVPCATHTRARRSPLSAWWVRLGIRPACIEPGNPQQNGRHERRQRTLTADTTRPPATTRRAHQYTFDRFRQEFTDPDIIN